MKNITAIILGGGRGSRLYPLTIERAKPAVSFGGKYRLIDIPISNCINSGIKRMFVLTQFLSASLHRHIMQTYQFDTFSDGFIDIIAAEQTPQREEWFQGTADAVRATMRHTMYYDAKQFLILSGDHLYRMNYAELFQFHQSRHADITVCVYPVERKEAPQLGLLKVDESGVVREVAEKPKEPKIINRFKAPHFLLDSFTLEFPSEMYLASMGIYIFEADILVDLLTNLNHTDFGGDVIPDAVARYKVLAYPFTEYWKDIGTIVSFFEANIALAQPNPPFKLYWPRWPFYTRTRSLPPSCIIRSEIRDSMLAEGSDISGAQIQDSIVGMRSIIREGTRLKEVVMMGADFYDGEEIITNQKLPHKDIPPLGIGKHCSIERAIIDKNARIGDKVIIRKKSQTKDYQGENYWVRDGITIIPKGAIIPSGSKL